MVARYLTLLLALILLGTAVPLRGQTEGVTIYSENLRFSVTEARPDSFHLVVENANTDQPWPEINRVRHNFWLAVPPKATATAELVDATWEVCDNGRVSAGLPRKGATPYGPMPAELGQSTFQYSDNWRTVGLARGEIAMTNPIATIKGPKEAIATLRRAEILVRLSGGETTGTLSLPSEVQEKDPYMMEVGKSFIANPSMIPMFSRVPRGNLEEDRQQKWNALLAEAAKSGPIAMLRATRPGVYQLTPLELRRCGVTPERFNTERMRFFLGDREIPVLQMGRSDGPFVAETGFIFVVPDFAATRTPYTPVWVMQFPTDSKLVSPTRPLIPSSNVPPDPLEELLPLKDSITLFEPRVFDHRYPSTNFSGKWATASIDMGKTWSSDFETTGVDLSKPAEITVTFGGFVAFGEQSGEVFINHRRLGATDTLRGFGPFEKHFAIPPGTLREGSNQLSIVYPTSYSEKAAPSLVYFHSRLTAQQAPVVTAMNRTMTLPPFSGKGGRLAMQVPPVKGRFEPFLFDITEPFRPVRLTTQHTTPTGPGVCVQAGVTPSKAERRFLVATNQNILYPAGGQVFDPKVLLQPAEGADYLVVTHPSLRQEVDKFVAYRQTPTRRVKVVEVDDIYAAFSYGYKDYRAIQELIRHAFVHWPGRRLSQVLLVGEASEYWWELRQRGDTVTRDLVPVFGWANPEAEIRGDDGYAQIAGTGQLPDLEVGRLSVSTPSELATVVGKIRDYEEHPPVGPWMIRHDLVTDDEPEFAQVANKLVRTELKAGSLPNRLFLQDFPYEDYFRIIARKRSTAMTDALVDAMSQGALTVTYFGHGGPNLWSSERIFHYRDIGRVDNQGRQPILVCASCDTAWVDYPVAPVQRSLGERELLSPRGGAIAVFAPIAGTSSYEHDYLLTAFFHALLHHEFDELGQTTLYSRMRYLVQRGQAMVSGQFILLGDPALKVPRPDDRIKVSTSRSAVLTNGAETVKITGEAPDLPYGVVEAVLLNKQGMEVGKPVRGFVRNDRFELVLKLPAGLLPGSNNLVVYAFNEAAGRLSVQTVPLPAAEPQIILNWSSDPPPTRRIDAGQPVTVSLDVQNTGTLQVQDLVLELRDVVHDSLLTSTTLALGPGKSFSRAFKLPAPKGITIFEARVLYQGTVEGSEPIVSSQFVLRGLSPDLPAFDVPSNQATVTRSAAPVFTVLEVPVYNMTDKPTPPRRARLMILDRPEGTRVGGEITLPSIPPLGRAVASFSSEEKFPAARLPFRMHLSPVDAATSDTLPTQEVSFLLKVGTGTDLAIVPGSVRTEQREYVQGHTVFLRALVRNTGSNPVPKVRVAGYRETPWWPENMLKPAQGDPYVEVPGGLAPGQEREVRLRWDPNGLPPDNLHLYVCVNPERDVRETDFANNIGETVVSFARLPNLALQTDQVRVSQRLVQPGDVVRLTIPFSNNSEFDFPYPFVLQLSARSPLSADQVVYRSNMEALGPGQMGLVQTAWKVGEFQNALSISLNDDREYGESNSADNEMTLPFEYVLDPRILADDAGDIVFGGNLGYGKFQGLSLLPTGQLSIDARPRTAPEAIKFRNEYVVGEPLPLLKGGPDDDSDNTWNLQAHTGSIYGSAYEDLPPVRFRIPLPADDGTTIYDIYLNQLGSNSPDGKRSNILQFKVEDDADWTKWNDQSRGIAYFRRVDTKDHYLDITISGVPEEPAWNALFGILPEPVAGNYTSAIIQGAIPGNARLEFSRGNSSGGDILLEARWGRGDREHPEWGKWAPLGPEGQLPPHHSADVFCQWKVRLIGTMKVQPTFGNPRITTKPPARGS